MIVIAVIGVSILAAVALVAAYGFGYEAGRLETLERLEAAGFLTICEGVQTHERD